MQSVQSAGRLNVQGASENILLADTVGSPGKLKAIHLVMTRSSESVSDMPPPTVREVPFCCALICVFMARVRYK
jgi:hypothetical protein